MNDTLPVVDETISIVPELVIPDGATPITSEDGAVIGYFQDKEFSEETPEASNS